MAEEPSCRSPYHEEYIQTYLVRQNPVYLVFWFQLLPHKLNFFPEMLNRGWLLYEGIFEVIDCINQSFWVLPVGSLNRLKPRNQFFILFAKPCLFLSFQTQLAAV